MPASLSPHQIASLSIDTQRSLFRLQDQLAESEGKQVQDLVGLYRAMGGGWDVAAEDVARPAGLADYLPTREAIGDEPGR